MRAKGVYIDVPPYLPRTKVAEIGVPAGESWRIREIKVAQWPDRVSLALWVTVHAGPSSEEVCRLTTFLPTWYRLPYPADAIAPSGSVVTLEVENPTGEYVDLWVELLYEVAR